jgi:hypothetical protein
MTNEELDILGIDPDLIDIYLIFIGSLTGTGQKCCQVIGKKNGDKKLAIKTLIKVVEEIKRASEEIQIYLPVKAILENKGKIH